MSNGTLSSRHHSKATGGKAAALVGAGILLSRIAGLVRERVFAHFLGNSDAADVFKAALRIPNFLQNLFGEGVLSASFIPIYARLRAEGREDEAQSVARLVGLLLLCATSLLAALGIALTPVLIDLIAPGFEGEKREAVIQLVRILFPSAALLVLSAWCLGVLNSHGRFFLSYTAPVIWNVIIIAALIMLGGRFTGYDLTQMIAWSVVLGSFLQTAIQLPSTFRMLGVNRASLRAGADGVRRVLRGFGPAFLGRGVVQISAFIDSMIASFLPSGAMAALAYAQTVYLLPVSLFGMSISAAALPEMSSSAHGTDRRGALARQLERGLSRIAFFVVPSIVAFLGLGDLIAIVLFQSGKFTYDDSLYVWAILAGSTIGLLAGTLGRLYASVHFALHDTKHPLYFASLRVLFGAAAGWFFSLHAPSWFEIDPKWGAAFLSASSGSVAWLEFLLLKRSVLKHVPHTPVPARLLVRLWMISIVALIPAWAIKFGMPQLNLLTALLSLASYGLTYLLLAPLTGAGNVWDRMRAMVRR